jgi:hypothetical protein
MSKSLFRAALVVAAATLFGACGGKNDRARFQAAVDSMTPHLDSTKRALDSSGARKVDTTKLGAAKTESILSKARKTP